MAERARRRAQMQKLRTSRMLSGSGSGKGTSAPGVLRRDGSDFPSVVLALPARNILPEKKLPPRKRTLFRSGEELELREEMEATAEGPANATSAPKKEELGEIKGGNSSENNSAHCVLNWESSIPFPNIESLSIREPVMRGEEEERKQGQPKNEGSKSPQGKTSGNF